MKKILLLTVMLLGLGSVTYADEVTVLVPDEEYTSIGDLNGKIFAIVNTTDGKALYNPNDQVLGYDTYFDAFAASNAGYYWKLISLDDNADASVHGCYALRAVKPDGSTYGFWNWGEPYLNTQPEGREDVCFCLCLGDNLGQDVKYGAVWEIEYVADHGFTLKNKALGGYFTSPNALANSNTPAYFSFCSLKEGTMENPIAESTYDATDANTDAFAGFKAIGNGATWNATTKTATGVCGWQWDNNGVDLSNYRYIVITALQSREGAGDGKMSIKDNSGRVVAGDDYGVAYGNLWFSMWNHLYCATIDLEKLRQEKLFDIYHIKELTIECGDGFMLGNAYATNKKPIAGNRWGIENEGSYRTDNGVDDNKYGTICLPYQAAVACAKIYEISSKDESGINLTEVEGLMEAGKPYFYCRVPNKVDEFNDWDGTLITCQKRVFFYQATAATVDEPGENNGLIGTFETTTAPMDGKCSVLYNNDLYSVDSEVTVAANKAWIDRTKIVNTGIEAKAFIFFEDEPDATDITAVDVEDTLNGTFYDLSGREVTNPTPGIYIVNGKKVMIK